MKDPEIPEKVYFRIGEVCRLAGIEPHVLRFWESEFPQIRPSKTSGGFRLYRKSDVEIIFQIKFLLYEKGFTIPGARSELSQAAKTGEAVKPSEIAAIQKALNILKGIKTLLAD